MDTPPETDAGNIELGRSQGHIEFDQVQFRYPGAERAALKGISFNMPSVPSRWCATRPWRNSSSSTASDPG